MPAEDRRITRSKRALRDALVELIEERGLTNFSASDLCARADLNRGTLYNNFGDMEGLLAALEDDIMDDLENLQSCMQRLSLKDVLRYRVNKKPMPFLVKLFDYLREQGDFLHAIMGPKGDPELRPARARCRVHRDHPNHPARALPQRPLAVRAILRGVLRERVSRGHHPLDRDGHEGKLGRRWPLWPCACSSSNPATPFDCKE